MVKTTKSTTKSKDMSKEHTEIKKPTKWLEDYTHLFTRRQTPMTESGLERMAQEMVKWAYEDKNALRPWDFAAIKGIGRKTYYEWIERYPVIANAHQDVLAIIGSRREIGAIKREYSEKTILFSLHRYDPEALEDTKFHASLKAEAEAKATTNYVVKNVEVQMPNFGNSPLVPEKKDKNGM